MKRSKKEPQKISGIQIYTAVVGTVAFIVSIVSILFK